MSRKPLNQSPSMPNPTGAFSGWQSQLTIIKVSQFIENGFVKEKLTPVSFNGVIQPLSPEQLNLKPETLRSFRWLQIHVYSGDLNLKTNDKIEVDGKRFKVMGILDYQRNGFVEYHAIEDFETDISQ